MNSCNLSKISDNITMINIDDSICSNDLESLKSAIAREEDPNIANRFGNPPIFIAVQRSFIEGLKELLKCPNIDLNNKSTSFGYTPLMESAFGDKFEYAKLLVEAGADINCLTDGKRTPLMESCSKKNFEITKYLMNKDADLNLVDKDGYTAFFIAIQNDSYDTFSLMMNNRKCNVFYQDENGNNAAHHICSRENESMAKDFCKKAHAEGQIETVKNHLALTKTKFKEEPSSFYYYFNSMVNSIALHDSLKVLETDNSSINSVGKKAMKL